MSGDICLIFNKVSKNRRKTGEKPENLKNWVRNDRGLVCWIVTC